MSKKKSQVLAGIETSTGRINMKTLFLTTAIILIIPILAQGQFPNGYEISGYVTYGTIGVSGVTVTAVGIGDFTGYLGLDMTDYSGYYNLPVPDGFSGNVEAFKSGYTFDPSSRYYSSVESDMENQNFSASNGSPPPPPPSITVTSPNGGESWLRGTLHDITWDSAGDVGSDVRIELYKGGALNLKITGSTANDGSYDWTVPLDQAIDSDYMIKITSTSNPAFFDESDDYFSIDEVSQILFEETFPSLKIGPKKWMVVSSVKVDNMGINEPSPDYSLRLNGHPSGGDLIESVVIDLSSYAGATLTYYYQRTGSGNSPEQGEDLTIEYFDGDSWVELDRQPGDGPDMDNYDQVIIPLPPEALHEGFSFRISNKGSLHASQRYDDWFVDDIKIEVTDDDDDNIAYPVKLIADDGDYGDWFGRRVSISGKYVIAGALHDNDDRGSAYIFERSAADWIQQAKLTASSPAAGDQFGCSVSISGDNAIVGADRNDYNGPWSGAAYIFERTNAGWIQQTMLVPSDGRVGDRFGCAVSAWSAVSIRH